MDIAMFKTHTLSIALIIVQILPFMQCQNVFGSFGGDALNSFTSGLSKRVQANANDLPARGPGGLVTSNTDRNGNTVTGNSASQNNFGPGMQQFSGMSNSLDQSGNNGYGGDNDSGPHYNNYRQTVPNTNDIYIRNPALRGYYEVNVKPVPLAQQGWDLYIPRPVVEITTPTTTTLATTRPASTAGASTTAPTTRTSTSAAIGVPATGNSTGPTSVNSSSVGLPSGGSGLGGGGGRVIPQMFMMNGRRVMLMPLTSSQSVSSSTNNNNGFFSSASSLPGMSVFKSSLPNTGLQVDINTHGPITCSPKMSPNASGVCVIDSEIAAACSNMIVSSSNMCSFNQFCCYIDS